MEGEKSDRNIMHHLPYYDMRAARQFLSREDTDSMEDYKRQCRALLKSTEKCFKKKASRLKRSVLYLSLLYHPQNTVGIVATDSLHSITFHYNTLVHALERGMTSPRRTRTTSLDSARQESLRIGLELDLMNQSIHKELGRLHTVHSSVLTTLLNHLPYGMLPVFSFLGPADVAAALSVCRSWLSMLTAYCTLSQAFSHPHERWQYWQRYLLIQTTKTSPDLDHLHIDDIVVSRVCTDDIRDVALLDQEVHRTTFFPKESMYMPALLSKSPPSGSTTSLPRIGSYSSRSPALKSLHQKLHHLLSTFAHQYPQVGYGHGMTFVGAALLSTLQYDMDASYRVFVTFMEKHGMHHLWHASPSSFGAGLPRRLCQLERCVDVYAPEVAAHLRAHSISTSMFASSWILSLFLNDRSLPPSTCMHILDTFLVEGWLAMYALYIGLIVVHAKELVVATDEASILHALLSLPKHLAMHGLGPYRMCALTTLSPSLATMLSLEIEQEPHP